MAQSISGNRCGKVGSEKQPSYSIALRYKPSAENVGVFASDVGVAESLLVPLHAEAPSVNAHAARSPTTTRNLRVKIEECMVQSIPAKVHVAAHRYPPIQLAVRGKGDAVGLRHDGQRDDLYRDGELDAQ